MTCPDNKCPEITTNVAKLSEKNLLNFYPRQTLIRRGHCQKVSWYQVFIKYFVKAKAKVDNNGDEVAEVSQTKHLIVCPILIFSLRPKPHFADGASMASSNISQHQHSVWRLSFDNGEYWVSDYIMRGIINQSSPWLNYCDQRTKKLRGPRNLQALLGWRLEDGQEGRQRKVWIRSKEMKYDCGKYAQKAVIRHTW